MKIMIFTKMISQNLRKNLCKNRLKIVEIFQKRTEHGSVAIQFVNLTVMETCETISFWFARRPAGDLKVKFNIRGINFIRLRNSFKNSILRSFIKTARFFQHPLKARERKLFVEESPRARRSARSFELAGKFGS